MNRIRKRIDNDTTLVGQKNIIKIKHKSIFIKTVIYNGDKIKRGRNKKRMWELINGEMKND